MRMFKDDSKKFTCDSCTSFCCMTPPMLEGEEELRKAKAHGVRVIATKVNPQETTYYVSVAKNSEGVCPFLAPYGCSIYGNNFKVCSDFSCQAKEKSIEELKELVKLSPMAFFDALSTSSKKIKRPIGFTYEMLQRYEVEIVSKEVAVELVNVSNIEKIVSGLYKIQEKLGSDRK